MTERDYLTFFLWFLAFMVAVGAMIPALWPGLVRFVHDRILGDGESPGGSGH